MTPDEKVTDVISGIFGALIVGSLLMGFTGNGWLSFGVGLFVFVFVVALLAKRGRESVIKPNRTDDRCSLH